MLAKIKSFFVNLGNIEFSVPAIFGGANISVKENQSLRHKKYRLLDKIIGFFGKAKKGDDILNVTYKPRKIGMIAILIFFGFFGLWASFAPLDGAVIATGEIIAKSDRKIIQHLEGGIIQKLLVEEGEKVQEGQELMFLNDTNAKTQVGILTERGFALESAEARLVAERDGKDEVHFPNDEKFERLDITKKSKIIDNQLALFSARKNSLENQISIIGKKIDQAKNELEALDAQLISAQKQLEIVEEDLSDKKTLFEKKIIDKAKIMMLEREQANWAGKIAELKAHTSRTQQKIAESELEIVNLQNRFNNTVVDELKEVAQLVNENNQKLSAAIDVLERTTIKAPQNGKVTGLKYNSVGGIIPSGATIMEITPTDQNMVVEAKVMPNNIESVLTSKIKQSNNVNFDGIEGVAAKVRLTAFSSRKVGLLNAVMTYVSADTISDPRTGMQYYLAYVKIPDSEIKNMNADVALYPGMPAVVYITTESRTLLSYLLSPITSTFENAFRER